MKRIRSNYHSLHALKDARPKLRSVGECALNVLQGNVKLSECAKRKLRKFRRQLRTVADRHVPVARKKNVIIQSGGFLVSLLSVVLPTIASLVYDYFKNFYYVTQDVSCFP